MRSWSKFMRVSGFVGTVAILVLASLASGNIQAGPLAQGTATMAATSAAGGTMAATSTMAEQWPPPPVQEVERLLQLPVQRQQWPRRWLPQLVLAVRQVQQTAHRLSPC